MGKTTLRERGPLLECGYRVRIRVLPGEDALAIREMFESPSRALDELTQATIVQLDMRDVRGMKPDEMPNFEGIDVRKQENRETFHQWWTDLHARDRSLLVMTYNDLHGMTEQQREDFRKSEKLVTLDD